MKIAPSQREQLTFLHETLDGLDRHVSRDMRPAFRDLRERLDNWASRIAVIGQVKAGKSTFLNAFLYNHDFLPSDVNPWTSVVTNVRVNVPGDPPSGARFEFFAESDWNEIVSGDAKIRKLTEKLLPGFDTELLRQQSDEMRARAEARLGRHFTELLGTHHDYDFVTGDLLKTYVCAGPGGEGVSENERLGRYASLTKFANVYSRMPEFLVPAIITDTPGVNDPFLVRDEFTCRSLDRSDVFIVVLSAHQPLTEVDIALIRILAEQDDKDVLVFVNRIDELDSYDSDVPRVLNDVSRRLRAAIPDIDFKIVAGSGYMADLILRDGPEADAERAALDDTRLARYLKSRFGYLPDDRDERLYLASGVGEIKMELSRVIDSGVGRHQLAQIMTDIRAELGGALFATRRERDSVHNQAASISSEVANMAVESLKSEIGDIKRVREDLETIVDNAEASVEKLLSKAWSQLEKRLVRAIDEFVTLQKPALEERIFLDNLRGGGVVKPVDIDLAPLQRKMEQEIVAAWNVSRAGTDTVLSNCLSACQLAVNKVFDEPPENISLSDLPFQNFNTTLTLAKRTLRMTPVSQRSWAFWRKPDVNTEKTLDALRAIAAEELRPPMEKLLAVFNEAQNERAEAGNGRVRVMLRMFDLSLTQMGQRLKKDMAELEVVATNPEVRRQMSHRLQSQIEVLDRRLINLSAIESALARSTMSKAA